MTGIRPYVGVVAVANLADRGRRIRAGITVKGRVFASVSPGARKSVL
jgi:hypothetical protein